jgi:type IV pilus assembly protein PilC
MDQFMNQMVEAYLKNKDQWSFGTKDKIFFYREMSYLIEWWVSILDAVSTIASTTDNYAIKWICQTIEWELNAGQSFSKALGKLTKYFSEGDVNIIKSGESSWEMITILKSLAREYEFLSAMTGSFIGAMIYPGILFTLSIWGMFFLFIKILPGIFQIVKDFGGIELPATTRLMIQFTDFMVADWGKILMAMWAVLAVLSIIRSSESGKKRMREIFLVLPGFWPLLKYYHMVKFFRYFKLMQMSGMNYLEIFMYLREIMDMPMYKTMIDTVITGIKKWETIYSNIRYFTNIIPADVMVLIKVWEQTASLGGALENVINIYSDELQKGIEGISKFIEPVMIVFAWWIIMAIATSVFWVIWSILEAAQSSGG